MDYETILNRQFVMTDTGRIDRVKDLYTTFNPEVDLEALKKGGFLEALNEMMEPVLMDLDDHSPAVLAYWAKRGMVKEFHGRDKPMSWSEYEMKTGYHWREPVGGAPQNRTKGWNAFVPVSAFAPENEGRLYPAVVMLHGGFNPVSIVDGWGFPQEAARREWIVIAPALELDDLLDEVLAEAMALYPIDPERIYIAGFSYGGFMTNTIACKRPDVYAAAAPCGAPLSSGWVGEAIGGEPQTPFDGVYRGKSYMPVMNVIGNLDGHRFPYYDYHGFMHFQDGPEALVEGLNHWARVNGALEVSLEAVMALKGREGLSPEERNIGLPLAPDCRRTVVADGVTNYIADLKSADGIVRVRVMCEMNMPHWPTPEMVRQIFDFFSHFSRDRETGESIYTP